MKYYSAIKNNEFESVLMKWIKLQFYPLTLQSEVSQQEKHQHSILMHIYGIQKGGNDDPICEIVRDTDVKNRLLDSVGEGEDGMIRENSTETCVLPYVKQMISPCSVHKTGHSKPVHWDIPEGWDGEGRRRVLGWGDTCTPMADSCQCMEKTIL